jgi:hypothetical protein
MRGRTLMKTMKLGPADSNNANDLDFGNPRWRLAKMLHQLREWAEEVTPTFCCSV